jgi:mRNA-degrading endonuclease RelE of RelBE toxin-antitoxin system
VGEYRVIYRIDDQRSAVHVLRIAHRSEAYE